MGTAASNYLDGQGTIEVQCRKLDDILAGKKPSYIKMDIEGAEPDAVAGAEQVIKMHHPVMASHHFSSLRAEPTPWPLANVSEESWPVRAVVRLPTQS